MSLTSDSFCSSLVAFLAGVFSCSCLLCFWVAAFAEFSLLLPYPPSLYLLFGHWICNESLFLLLLCVFSCPLFFPAIITCYCFCRLCCLCFVAALYQVVSCVSASFCSAVFACFLMLGNSCEV